MKEISSADLAVIAPQIKELAKKVPSLIEFLRKNSNYDYAVALELMKAKTSINLVASQTNNKDAKSMLTELAKRLTFSAEKLFDQENIFSYCASVNKKEENND